MNMKINVVTNIIYEGYLWDRVCKTFESANLIRIEPGDPVKLKQALETADIAVLQELLPPSDIRGNKLRWVHITHSGADRVADPDILERGIRLSSSAGYSVEALAEHAMFFILSLAFRSIVKQKSEFFSDWDVVLVERGELLQRQEGMCPAQKPDTKVLPA